MIGLIVTILGALFGSFYLVVGERLPLHKDIIMDRSECDYCHTKLKWYELIPIFSYVFLKGKCRTCHKKINSLNIIIELVTAFLFLIGYLYLGLNIRYFIYLVGVSLALIIFVSDFKYMIILDSPLIVATIILIVLKYIELGFKDTIVAIFLGVCTFFTMYLIKVIGDKLFKKESLGGGDIKLAFFIGIFLGYPHIGYELSLICLIFASFLALPYALMSVYLKKKNELPYGPFLISAMIIIFVFLDKFTNLLVFFNL